MKSHTSKDRDSTTYEEWVSQSKNVRSEETGPHHTRISAFICSFAHKTFMRWRRQATSTKNPCYNLAFVNIRPFVHNIYFLHINALLIVRCCFFLSLSLCCVFFSVVFSMVFGRLVDSFIVCYVIRMPRCASFLCLILVLALVMVLVLVSMLWKFFVAFANAAPSHYFILFSTHSQFIPFDSCFVFYSCKTFSLCCSSIYLVLYIIIEAP